MQLHNSTKQDGFILVLTLLVISLAVVIVSQFATRGSLHLYFDKTMIAREQAKNLALNGLQIAMCQLHLERPKKETPAQGKPEGPTKESKKEPHVAFLERVLPLLNTMQTFKLTKDIDGVDGTIQLFITSEDGKINISQLYDHEKHTFFEITKGQDNTKKLFTALFTALKKNNAPDLLEPFQKYMKDRDIELDDATDLLSEPAFNAQFKHQIFLEGYPANAKEQKNGPIALTDLFTVWSDSALIQPWLLSPSVKTVLDIKQKSVAKEGIEQIVKGAKLQESDAKSLWDNQLKKLYGKEFATLPKEIEPFWSTKFEANTFCVLSYGVVDHITQKVLVIIKRATSYETKVDEFELIKIYWL